MYGARPLKRVIQQRIQNILAMRLLEGEIGEGDRIRVDVREGALTFEKAGAGGGQELLRG